MRVSDVKVFGERVVVNGFGFRVGLGLAGQEDHLPWQPCTTRTLTQASADFNRSFTLSTFS